MTYLTVLEDDARAGVRLIRDLEGVTPEFIAAVDRSRQSLDDHLALIRTENQKLSAIRTEAATYFAAIFGTEASVFAPTEMPAEITEAEVEAVLFQEPAPAEAVLAELTDEDAPTERDEIDSRLIGYAEPQPIAATMEPVSIVSTDALEVEPEPDMREAVAQLAEATPGARVETIAEPLTDLQPPAPDDAPYARSRGLFGFSPFGAPLRPVTGS